ncbi:MAG TPA: adenylate/guanylate cyclase domain-containing protein [Candidatus Krumholzibacteria bacterium]
MDPKIRYAKSADGTSIAYWAIGEGPALVHMPTVPWCHIQREWAIPEWRRRYERLANGRTLIRYDARGFGLSDPRPKGVTPADHADDIDAVLNALDVAECNLLAIGDAGFAAVEYCARQTARVTRLILWGAYVSRDAVSNSPKTKSLRALWDEDWLQYTEMAVRTVLGWKHEDRAGQLVDFYRAAASPESLRSVLGPLNAVDLTALLPSVQVPTLVVALDDAWLDMRDEWRRQATELPNAELRTARGETLGVFDFYDEEDDVVTILNDFLGGGAPEAAPSMAAAAPPLGGLRTILFTDIVGHTEMMQRLGDAKGRDILREHERITRETLAAYGGTEVKTMGDGFMASFGSVTKAMDCAIALQRAFAAHDGEPLLVRVGLNAGEPIEEDGDLFGSTVILASRIAAKAEGGEILVADTVRGLCSGKGFLFADRGEFVVKGFEEPVRVYEVRWRE